MTALLAAHAGNWEPFDADAVLWRSRDDAHRALLDPREHAALVACATFRPREEHAATIAVRLGLTGSRASRLIDALLQRGLLVSADSVLGAAAHDGDDRLGFATDAAPAGDPRFSSAPDAHALVGATWRELAARFGIDRRSLPGCGPEVLVPLLADARVRAVVGAHVSWSGALAPTQISAAECAAAAVLARDDASPQPRAIGDAALEGAWLVLAHDAMHGPGSVLAVPHAGAGVPHAHAGAIAALQVLAGRARRFASRDATTRFDALLALADDLAAARDEQLGALLLRARRATLARRLERAAVAARATLEADLLATALHVDDVAAAREAFARIAHGRLQ